MTHYKADKDKKYILLSFGCTSYTYPTSFYEGMSIFLLAPFHFPLFPSPVLSLFPSIRSTSIEIKLEVGKVMEELVDKDSALPEGSTIIGGQYRLVELL
ncbi:MAG: hypothetical protein ACJ8DI_15585, partial [Ktedonobacteraceae bacterium]